jgi:hypothetical protein
MICKTVKAKPQGDLTPISALVPRELKQRLRTTVPSSNPLKRLSEWAAEIEQMAIKDPFYMHSAFCQICFPPQDPGDEVRRWAYQNGRVFVDLRAGTVLDPRTDEYVEIGLPWGTRSRMLLMHINQQAMFTKDPEIETDKNLNTFTKKMGLSHTGPNQRSLKSQLTRLSALNFQIDMPRKDEKNGHFYTNTVRGLFVQNSKDWFLFENGHDVVWPKKIILSLDYLKDLLKYGVPLNEHHIHALRHSALALDIYCWLAQRLWILDAPQHISWVAIQRQFGQGYDLKRIDKFRQVFLMALREVLLVYKVGKSIKLDERKPKSYSTGPGLSIVREPALKGLTISYAPPPVPRYWMTHLR